MVMEAVQADGSVAISRRLGGTVEHLTADQAGRLRWSKTGQAPAQNATGQADHEAPGTHFTPDYASSILESRRTGKPA